MTLVIFHFFDARDLWLNLVTVPLRHPWASFEELIMVTTPFNHPTPSLNKWESAWKVISELFRVILIPCILLLLAVFNDVKEGHFKQGFSRWMASNPWLVFVLMGVLLLPSAFLGRVKIGGGVNNYGLSLYFLLTAALLATLRKRSGIFLLCALIALLAVQNRAILLRNPVAPNESRVATDMAWRFALRHPGEVYYPGIPLASVMAEKKAYHSSVGVWEREAARIPLGRSQFSAGLPAKMKWIVLGPSYGFMPILVPFSRRFRDISITEIQELPGWVAFVKDHA